MLVSLLLRLNLQLFMHLWEVVEQFVALLNLQHVQGTLNVG